MKNILKNYKIDNNKSPSNLSNISKNDNDNDKFNYNNYDNENQEKKSLKLHLDFLENEKENKIGLNEKIQIKEKKVINNNLDKVKFLINENEDIFKKSKSDVRKSISKSIDNHNNKFFNYNLINENNEFKNTQLNISNNPYNRNENLIENDQLNMNLNFKIKSRDISHDERKDYSQKLNKIQMKLNNKYLFKKQKNNILISTPNMKSPEIKYINSSQIKKINQIDKENDNYIDFDNDINTFKNNNNFYNIQKTTKNINCSYNLNSITSYSNLINNYNRYQGLEKDKDNDKNKDTDNFIDKDYNNISYSNKRINFRKREISASPLSRRINSNYTENYHEHELDKDNYNNLINLNPFRINYSNVNNNDNTKDEHKYNNKKFGEKSSEIKDGYIINNSHKDDSYKNIQNENDFQYVSFKNNEINTPNHEGVSIRKNNDKIQLVLNENTNIDNFLLNIKDSKTPRVNNFYEINKYYNNNFDNIENLTFMVKFEKFLEIFKSPENFKMNFLKEKFGINKFNMLIDLFEKSKNIEENLNDDQLLKFILGDEFKVAKNFLKNIYKEIH